MVSLSRLQVVLPLVIAQSCHLSHLPYATWQRWSRADIRLTPGPGRWEQWSPEGSVGVGVRQMEGCTRRGDHITLQASSLLMRAEDNSEKLETLGRSLVAGWARYRWGVFEERGYPGHTQYPLPHACTGDNTDCSQTPTMSLMKKITLDQPVKFCDLDNHDYESPNLQNLACAGRSISEVIRHNPDFANSKPYYGNGKDIKDEVEVIRPHSGGRVVDHHSFHVDGDIDRYLKEVERSNKGGNVDAKAFDAVENPGEEPTEEVKELEERNLDLIGSGNNSSESDPVLESLVQSNNTDANSTSEREAAHVSWQPQRAKRAVPQDEAAPTVEGVEATANSVNASDVLPTTTPSTLQVLKATTASLPLSKVEDDASIYSLDLSGGPELRRVEDLPDILINKTSNKGQEDVDIPPSPSNSSALPSLGSPPIAPLLLSPSLPLPLPAPPSIRPEAQGFSSVPLELLISPPAVIVVALDLSQAAIDEVGVETLRGGLLRWMWGLGGSSRLSILAAYNNESFPLTLSPLPPAPSSRAQLEARLALLPTEHEAASGVYGGRYCLPCVLDQAKQIVTQGGATVESAVLVVAACRPKVTSHERKILETVGMIVHTIALCATAAPELDQLAAPHAAWVLPSNAGPQDGERQFARTLQAVMAHSAVSPLDSSLLQVREYGRRVDREELQHSGAYTLVGGTLHLGSAASKTLLVLCATSPAKVVEIRDGDGRRLEIVRDTGHRFYVEVSGPGQISYTFKFLSTSLAYPLYVSEDLYDQDTGSSGVRVHLSTNNAEHAPLNPDSPPLVVWADITMDGWPLVGAVVTLSVTHLPSGISSNFTLLDNGSTEPDLRAGDGVYSRYLSWRLGEGRYSLTAMATQGHSTVMATTQDDGLVLHSSSGPFTAVSAARTLYVSRVSFEDTAPPSRVTDLTARLVEEGMHTFVNLSWTAPGGELDQGAASRYELKMYTERQALTQDRFNSSGIAVYCLVGGLRSPPPPPALFGTAQHCLATVPFSDLKWYFAMRAIDSANNTGRVSNIVWIFVPKPPPTTLAATVGSTPAHATVDEEYGSPLNVSAVGVPGSGGGWRSYVVAGAAVLGLLMVGAAAIACICCCRKAKARKEKDPDRPVYKIYVNNAYIQEDDGEIKVVSNGRFNSSDEKRSGQVQEWVNSLDKYGNIEGADVTADGTELKNKASFKYTSPVRFGVLTNGSIMRDATTGSTNSSGSSSRPASDEAQQDDYKYRDLSETTSDSTTDGLPPFSSSSAATDVPPISTQQMEFVPPSTSANVVIPPGYPTPPKSASFKNTNISSLPLPSPRKNPPPTPPVTQGPTTQLSVHNPHSGGNFGYTSEEEGGFRPRTSSKPPIARGSPPPPSRRQLPQHFSSFRYLPPPPQYRTSEFGPHQLQHQQRPSVQQQQQQHQQQLSDHSPVATPMSRVNGSLSHGTVRSVKKRRHISFV